MEQNQQTIQQVGRALEKIFAKFPQNDESIVFTDIHLRANQDNGDFLAFDDDENEINRCVVDEWINNTEDTFYQQITAFLRNQLKDNQEKIDSLGIAKPFSFVLEDDDRETIAELYLADDDTIIIGGDLMEDLDSDLDNFFEDLMKK